MIEVFIKSKKGADAKGIYNEMTNETIVLKGSKVSDYISTSKSFRGIESINNQRSKYCNKNGTVKKDVIFNSSSTAANFVTGTSSNGLTVWKDCKGKTLKDILKNER